MQIKEITDKNMYRENRGEHETIKKYILGDNTIEINNNFFTIK